MVNRSILWLIAKTLLAGFGVVGVCGCNASATLQDAARNQFQSAMEGFFNETISTVIYGMLGIS